MARLIYSSIASLDGFVADDEGNFDWARPDEELHTFVNELERPIATYLYGRVMYELMTFWETLPDFAEQPRVMREFAEIWRRADKIVYSRTLERVTSERTRIERVFDPATVRQLKTTLPTDMTVGGPDLAAQAMDAGLVDECHLFLVPVLLGSGKPALRSAHRTELELLHEHRFRSGVVHLHYRTLASSRADGALERRA